MKEVLLIGDTSVPEALGSKLLRGAKGLDASDEWRIQTSYHSPAHNYSPSMEKLRGKIFYRLAGKRSWEWWRFQRELHDKIITIKPHLVIVTGIFPLDPAIFESVKSADGIIVNYLTDDPWNPIHRRESFLKNLHQYNHIFSTKKTLQIRLEKHGTPSTSWLPFAYDPSLHYPIKSKQEADVVFIGTGAKERLRWLNALRELEGVKKHIHGNSWNGISTPSWEKLPAVTGENYCKAITSAKIVLGLLREANGDQSTDRSYEIGAIGGCGLYQNTDEHRQLLHGYPEEGFFRSPGDLAQKVKIILNDEALQEELRVRGAKAIRKAGNTYSARLKSILSWSKL